jgi:hypothetical protein
MTQWTPGPGIQVLTAENPNGSWIVGLGASSPEQAGSQPDRHRQTTIALRHSAISMADLSTRQTSSVAGTAATAPAPIGPLAGRQLCRCYKQRGSVTARGPTPAPIHTSERTDLPYSLHPLSFTKTPPRLHHVTGREQLPCCRLERQRNTGYPTSSSTAGRTVCRFTAGFRPRCSRNVVVS